MNAFRVAVLIASLIVVNGKVNFDSKTEFFFVKSKKKKGKKNLRKFHDFFFKLFFQFFFLFIK